MPKNLSSKDVAWILGKIGITLKDVVKKMSILEDMRAETVL